MKEKIRVKHWVSPGRIVCLVREREGEGGGAPWLTQRRDRGRKQKECGGNNLHQLDTCWCCVSFSAAVAWKVRMWNISLPVATSAACSRLPWQSDRPPTKCHILSNIKLWPFISFTPFSQYYLVKNHNLLRKTVSIWKSNVGCERPGLDFFPTNLGRRGTFKS